MMAPPAPALSIVGNVIQYRADTPAKQGLIADIQTGKGYLIDSQNDVGGAPKTAPSHRLPNVPAQGLEAWLDAFEKAVLNKI